MTGASDGVTGAVDTANASAPENTGITAMAMPLATVIEVSMKARRVICASLMPAGILTAASLIVLVPVPHFAVSDGHDTNFRAIPD